MELRRLLEFGSALDQDAAERLIHWGVRELIITKSLKANPQRLDWKSRIPEHERPPTRYLR